MDLGTSLVVAAGVLGVALPVSHQISKWGARAFVAYIAGKQAEEMREP